MTELWEFIFRDFWTFLGTLFLFGCLARIRAFEINHYNCTCDKKEHNYWRGDES